MLGVVTVTLQLRWIFQAVTLVNLIYVNKER